MFIAALFQNLYEKIDDAKENFIGNAKDLNGGGSNSLLVQTLF